MKKLRQMVLIALVVAACVPVLAAEEDSVAAVYAYGRTGIKLTSGFAVGDGSYVVTSLDSAVEVLNGKPAPVPFAVVVSRWTGDAYAAKVVATDDTKKLALLKLPAKAIPGVPLADSGAIKTARKSTMGEVLSGEEIGNPFSCDILGLKSLRSPTKYAVASWHASKAGTADMRNDTWLFLSRVTPADKVPDASLVIKRGLGAIGMFYRRLVVTGGPKPVTFYRVAPSALLTSFLTKAGVPSGDLSRPPAPGKQASDAEASFQAMCLMISSANTVAPDLAARASAAVKFRPKSAFAQMLLGVALSQQGKNEEALKAVDTALQIDPGIPDGSLNKALVLTTAGKMDDAEKLLRQVMKDDPKDIRPVVALVNNLLNDDKRVDEALSLAKTAVKIAPDNPGAHLTLARAMKHAKDYDGATTELKSLLKTAPKWADARAALAATYEAAGKPDLAEAEYRGIVSDLPTAIEPRLALIDFLITGGKQDAARTEIAEARKLKLEPGALEALKKLEEKLGEKPK